MTSERITVMGIGNPLVRDEGIGIRVVEELMSGYDFGPSVTVMDCGTMGMGILNLFRNCDFMLVVDAVDSDELEPGAVITLSPADIAPNHVLHSAHDIRFIDVLQAAELTGQVPEALVVGIQVADIAGLGIGLTPKVEAAVPAAVRAVIDILAERGVPASPRTEPAGQDAEVLRSIHSMELPPIDYEDPPSGLR
jgi:hydrogenase maturation protease